MFRLTFWVLAEVRDMLTPCFMLAVGAHLLVAYYLHLVRVR